MATRRNNVIEFRTGNSDFQTIVDDKLELLEAENKVKLLKKKTQLKEVCDLTKIKYREKTKQYYIYVKRVQYTGRTEQDLIEKLYEQFYGIEQSSMEGLFQDYMIYRRDETKTGSKTLYEHVNIWNKHFKGTALSRKPIKELTSSDFTKFFKKLAKENNLTEHRYQDLKAVPSCLLEYAIQIGIIKDNPTNHIDKNNIFFKSEAESKRRKEGKIISSTERSEMIKHLKKQDKDPYDIAIRFAYHNVLRIGEIKAIKWSDIDFQKRIVYVYSQVIDNQEMNDDLTFQKRKAVEIDHTKGGKAKGLRILPLSESCIKLLEQAKEYSGNSKYVFTYNGRTLTTETFNRRFKKYCEEMNQNKRSSHDIRFASASTLYFNNDKRDVTEVQYALGHTTVAMTFHYLEPVIGREERDNNYRTALG